MSRRRLDQMRAAILFCLTIKNDLAGQLTRQVASAEGSHTLQFRFASSQDLLPSNEAGASAMEPLLR